MSRAQSISDDEESPYRLATESRFTVKPVDCNELVDMHQHQDDSDDDCHSLVATEMDFRSRQNTDASQITYRDLSRMGILSSLGDAGSLLGSSLLLSTPSYLNISNEIEKNQVTKIGEATSMEYLDTIMENAEYIDTVKGKLPLAEAAKMISQDRSKHEELFNEVHIRKARIDSYKRLVCIGFSFLCLFASFFSLRNLQSSTTRDNATLGFVTFGCLTSLTWLGCIASNTVIYYVRPKWGLVIASVPFLLYPVANFYPAEYTLIPCALMCGLGMGLLWSAEGIYIIHLAATYAMISKKPLMEVIGKFNAVFFTMHQSSHIIGNILSSVLLSDSLNIFPKPFDAAVAAAEMSNTTTSVNAAINTTLSCGLSYSEASGTAVKNFVNVDPRQLMILYGVLTFLAAVGSLNLVLILRPLKTPKIAGNNNLSKNVIKFLRQFTSAQVWLLIPFMAYPGYSGSVAIADYTKAYITCAYGVQYIGYLLLTSACFSVTGAFTSGRLVHLTGRIPLFLFATLTSSGSMFVMRFWEPNSNQIGVMAFLPTCLWCLADGIILTQLNGFLSEIFRADLACALSMLHLWYGVGVVFGTLTSAFNFLSLTSKLYLGISHVWFSFILLVILELIRRANKEK